MVVISADEYGRPQVAPTVERMVKQFKGAATKKIGAPIWQKSYIEHVIRNKKDYQIRSNYISKIRYVGTMTNYIQKNMGMGKTER